MLIFVALLSRGFESITAPSFSTNFYDAQAKALLQGHMWVPSSVASLEGIQYGGHTYIYFGPFLALLRLPIIWLAPGAAGHLSQASMILAAAVLVAGASWLSWSVRTLVTRAVRGGRADLVLEGAFAGALLGGSVALYLAGSPSVYFETELWGAALATVAMGAFLSFVRTGAIVAAAALAISTAFDALTRLSVAIGPMALAAVALVLSIVGDRQGSSWLGPPRTLRRTAAPVLAAGVIVAVALPCWFNWVKFRSLVSVPWDRQVVALQDPSVGAFYHHHGVFVLANLPSALGWYLRPWTLLTTGLFPFFSFTSRPSVASHTQFLAVGRAASIPSSMPLLFLLGLAGVAILAAPGARPARAGSGQWAALRVVALASLLSTFPVLVFDTIANRYLADVLPLLLVTSLVALWWVRATWRPERRALLATSVSVAALALYSVLVNLSLGLQEALVFGPSPTPEQKAGLVAWQLSLHRALPLPFPASVGRQVPARAVPGQLFVQDGCAGVFQYNGPIWNQLEIGIDGGRRVMDVSVPAPTSTVTDPLLSAGAAGAPATYQYFSLEYGTSGQYRLLYESRPWDGFVHQRTVVSTPWYRLPADRQLHIDLTIAGQAPDGGRMEEARVAGAFDFFPDIPVEPTDSWTVGALPGQGPTPGLDIRLDAVPTPLCSETLQAIGSSGH